MAIYKPYSAVELAEFARDWAALAISGVRNGNVKIARMYGTQSAHVYHKALIEFEADIERQIAESDARIENENTIRKGLFQKREHPKLHADEFGFRD